MKTQPPQLELELEVLVVQLQQRGRHHRHWRCEATPGFLIQRDVGPGAGVPRPSRAAAFPQLREHLVLQVPLQVLRALSRCCRDLVLRQPRVRQLAAAAVLARLQTEPAARERR